MRYPLNYVRTAHFGKITAPKLEVRDCSEVNFNHLNFPEKCPEVGNIIPSEFRKETLLDKGNYYQEVKRVSINNIPYCLYIGHDFATGNELEAKYYLTVKNNKCLGIDLKAVYYDCSRHILGSEEYEKCEKYDQSTKEIINQIPSSFRFLE